MSALPAEQYCKPRKGKPIPTLMSGGDGEEEFLKDLMEPNCRLCKLCRRRGGFRPSAMRLFVCANCNHHKSAHGRSKHKMTEREAARRIQNVWRAYSANLMIIRMVKMIYEKHWVSLSSPILYYYFILFDLF